MFELCCNKNWNILLTNIRGYQSKALSLNSIVNTVKPSVVVVNETMCVNNQRVEIPGFTSFTANRVNGLGGGIATCVNDKESMHTLKVFNESKEFELMVTRHSQFKTPINIINIYGAIESRSCKEEIKKRWELILEQINLIEAKGELLVIIGDLNTHIGNIVEGNHDKIS